MRLCKRTREEERAKAMSSHLRMEKLCAAEVRGVPSAPAQGFLFTLPSRQH